MMLDAALTVMRPWPLKVVIDRVLSHKASRVPFLHSWLDSSAHTPMQILWGACAATFLIALGTGVFTYFFTRTLGNIGQRFAFDLRCHLFAHLQRLSLRFHDRQPLGDLITRLTSDTTAIQDVLASGVIILGSNGCLLLGMVTIMLWLNWRFALAALSVAPLLFVVVLRYSSRIKVAARQARLSTGLLASLAQETLASIRIVQGLAQEGQRDELFETQGANSLQASLEAVGYQARVAPLIDLLAAIGLILVMYYMIGHDEYPATTGDVVVFFAYVTNLYAPMRALARFSYVSNRAVVGSERIAEVLNVRSDVVDRKGARPAPRLDGRIEFLDVAFEYVPGQPVLSDINLTIEPGERIAVVGATGAGKTTFVSLIPRFYDPARGAVLINGEDLRNYSLQSLREQISLVLQDTLLFRGSVAHNIGYGRAGATRDEIVAAAVRANAHEFIERMPDGYDTELGERATNLSGGERQRIAIARALVRDAPILVLDEPTTGLDAESSHLVLQGLHELMKGRTTIIISHDLHLIQKADRIVVIQQGRIEQTGGHAELLREGGLYASLHARRFGEPGGRPEVVGFGPGRRTGAR